MDKKSIVSLSKSKIAREYIEKNYFKISRWVLIDTLMKETGLKEKTVAHIYSEISEKIRNVISVEVRCAINEHNSSRKQEKCVRRSLVFDDSSLYNGLMKSNKKNVG